MVRLVVDNFLTDPVLFQSLLCRVIFPRVLRSLFARVASFKEYSLVYEERSDVCVRVETLGQHVPNAELSCVSRIIDRLASCQWPLAVQGGSPLHRVLSDRQSYSGASFHRLS